MPYNRRKFFQTSLASVAATALPTGPDLVVEGANNTPKDAIRIGILGSGLPDQPGVTVTAIADIDPEMVRRTKEVFAEKSASEPVVYDPGPEDYRRLLVEADVDAGRQVCRPGSGWWF